MPTHPKLPVTIQSLPLLARSYRGAFKSGHGHTKGPVSQLIADKDLLFQPFRTRPTGRPGIEGVRYFSRVTRSIIAGILTVGSLDKTEPLTLPGNPEAATDQSNRDHDEKVHYGVAGKGDDRDEGYPKRAKFQTLRPPPRHPPPW